MTTPPIDPRARYLLELWDCDPNDDYNETAKGRWSEELAAKFVGKTRDLTFAEAAAAILTLFRDGWDSPTIYWARCDEHFRH